jgi:uncharacterized membrane protein YdjX (TVP38/TMEM64 family)
LNKQHRSTQKLVFWKKHGQKLVALVFWVILIAAYQWYAITNSLSPLEVVQRLLDFFTQGFWEPLIYIFLYAISPLILFPSTLLTLAAGFVFGLFLGISYTVIASNISFTVTF